jgi:hypothetical protein
MLLAGILKLKNKRLVGHTLPRLAEDCVCGRWPRWAAGWQASGWMVRGHACFNSCRVAPRPPSNSNQRPETGTTKSCCRLSFENSEKMLSELRGGDIDALVLDRFVGCCIAPPPKAPGSHTSRFAHAPPLTRPRCCHCLSSRRASAALRFLTHPNSGAWSAGRTLHVARSGLASLPGSPVLCLHRATPSEDGRMFTATHPTNLYPPYLQKEFH